MKRSKKLFSILFTLMFVLGMMPACCFADDAADKPFRADVFVGGNMVKACETVADFNAALAQPGTGDMVVKPANGVKYWNISEQVVIPAGSEYKISFETPEGFQFYVNDLNSTMLWCEDSVFKIAANNAAIDLSGIVFGGFNNVTNGAVAYITGNNCTVKNLNVSGMEISGSGGAIYTEGTGTVIEKCIFTNCTAASDGGAVCVKYGSGKISECKFDNCSSFGGKGDALYIGGGDTGVYKCEFTKTAVKSAICYLEYNANSNSNVYNDCLFAECKFTDNKPVAQGGFADIHGVAYALSTGGNKSYTQVVDCISNNPGNDSERFPNCEVLSTGTGTMESNGTPWLIIVIAALALGAAALIVLKKKKGNNAAA